MIPVLSKEEKPVVSGTTGLSVSADVKEVIAFCPSCKALETLWLTDDRLIQSRKFSQDGGQIYHDCGSCEPCRLYRMASAACSEAGNE